MEKIVRFALLAILLYLGYSYGMPWIQERLGGGPVSDSPGGRCAQEADRAFGTFDRRADRISAPGADAVVWGAFVADVQVAMATAQSACRCKEPSCRKGLEAMQELDGLLDQYDQRVRGTVRRWRNPVERQMRITGLISEAKNLARDGR